MSFATNFAFGSSFYIYSFDWHNKPVFFNSEPRAQGPLPCLTSQKSTFGKREDLHIIRQKILYRTVLC